jgi:hypothetical protein
VSGADLLRRAAEALRTHAQAATAGPWNADPAEIYGDTIATWVAESLNGSLPDAGAANSRFIALMHPGVALALADLLDRDAGLVDGFVNMMAATPELRDVVAEAQGEAAQSASVAESAEQVFAVQFALARAILREPPP